MRGDLDVADADEPDEVVWVWLVVDAELVPIGVIADPRQGSVRLDVTGDVTAVDEVVLSIETDLDGPDTPEPVVTQAAS